jgi:hypothetical protein
MAKLKPSYDVVELREDLRENRPLDASEFAIHLGPPARSPRGSASTWNGVSPSSR